MFISANRVRSHAAHGQISVKLIKIDHCYPYPKRGWWAGRAGKGPVGGPWWWLGRKNQEQRQL